MVCCAAFGIKPGFHKAYFPVGSHAAELLSVHSASLLSISHLNLVLSHDSMPLFPRINKVYSRYFGSSPPTRACVAVHFPPNDRSRIKLDGVARVGDTETSSSRTALHVQSLSYWGAANIGPYSQAITVCPFPSESIRAPRLIPAFASSQGRKSLLYRWTNPADSFFARTPCPSRLPSRNCSELATREEDRRSCSRRSMERLERGGDWLDRGTAKREPLERTS